MADSSGSLLKLIFRNAWKTKHLLQFSERGNGTRNLKVKKKKIESVRKTGRNPLAVKRFVPGPGVSGSKFRRSIHCWMRRVPISFPKRERKVDCRLETDREGSRRADVPFCFLCLWSSITSATNSVVFCLYALSRCNTLYPYQETTSVFIRSALLFFFSFHRIIDYEKWMCVKLLSFESEGVLKKKKGTAPTKKRKIKLTSFISTGYAINEHTLQWQTISLFWWNHHLESFILVCSAVKWRLHRPIKIR